jgi:S1-C subfamily serine protease
MNPGTKAAVKVYRGSQQLTFNVTLGELPAGS